MSKLWSNIKNFGRTPINDSKSYGDPELKRSQYSLVSQDLWMGLPDQVKQDPALAEINSLLNGHGKQGSPKIENHRLPLVKSAPALGSLQTIDSDKNEPSTRIQEFEVEEGEKPAKKKTKIAQFKYYTKMTTLLACWMFFTFVFLTYNEKDDTLFKTAVKPGEVKSLITSIKDASTSIQVKMHGPFITLEDEMRLNKKQLEDMEKMHVWIEKVSFGSNNNITYKEISSLWTLYLLNQTEIDFNQGELRSSIFNFESNGTHPETNHNYTIKINSTMSQTIPFSMSYTRRPLGVVTQIVFAIVLLLGLYTLIIFEVINRTMSAIIISTLSLAVLAVAGERPTLPEIVSWLEIETLLLLFSMMLLVALLAETGIFDFLAVSTFQLAKGKLWPLIYLLSGITILLSLFLDNVTTVLLMSPVTIRLCEVMDLDPVPILMFLAIYSNVGGIATPVGDPPNVIVVSNKAVIEAGINFTNFTAHMSVGMLLVLVQATLQIRYMYRDTNKLRLNVPRDIQDLHNQIAIWRRAAESLPHLSKDVHIVRERLERKIAKLSQQLAEREKESSKRACPKNTYVRTLADLKEKYKIRDKVLLGKSSIAVCFVVVLFFLHSIPEINRISLSWTALLGGILLLILADREDIEPILHRVEWTTLLFFAALFVLMEALSKLGLITFIGGMMEHVILMVGESARLPVAIVLTVWVSGLISAFVDNIPLTTMMIRVVVSIATDPTLNLPMEPLVWALLFGACLGGNGTLIGASANIVCAGVAEQHGYKFTFSRFFRIGFPLMLGHLVVATGYLILCHCIFEWH